MILGTTPLEENAFRVLKALDEWGTELDAPAQELQMASGLSAESLNEVIALLEEMQCVQVFRELSVSELRFVTARLTPHGRLVFQQTEAERSSTTLAGPVAVPIVTGTLDGDTISEVTRRNIQDSLSLDGVRWWGRLDEAEFLARVFDLNSLSSFDPRFKDVSGDIWQHRVNNADWGNDWVFTDSRFNLLRGPDETLLRFLCETLHPVVRPDAAEVASLLTLYNRNLEPDGWNIAEGMRLSGRPVYVARRKSALGIERELSEQLAAQVDTSYVSNQVTRLHTAIESGDYDLAIGTAKELIETICKTILKERRVPMDPMWDLPRLGKEAARILPLAPSTVDTQGEGIEALRILINSLTTSIEKIGQLRSLYGTGHGKEADASSLHRRHAQFIAATAAAVGIFLFQTHKESG